MNEVIEEFNQLKQEVNQRTRKIAIDMLNDSETYDEAVKKLQLLNDKSLTDLVYSEILKEALKEKAGH